MVSAIPPSCLRMNANIGLYCMSSYAPTDLRKSAADSDVTAPPENIARMDNLYNKVGVNKIRRPYNCVE